jgi:hypothetical protein
MSQPNCFTCRNNMVQASRWAPGPVWMGRENLIPTRIQSPDHAAHSKSLHQLCYPSPPSNLSITEIAKQVHIHTFICVYKIFSMVNMDTGLITKKQHLATALYMFHVQLSLLTYFSTFFK